MDSSNQEARADSLFAAGRLSEAAQLYRGILRNAPGRLDIQTRVGRLALLENNPQEAIDHLAFVLNNGLRSKAHWESLADAYLANGEPGSAALCYERAGRTGLAGTLAVMASLEPCRVEGDADPHEFEWLPDAPMPVIQAEVNGIPLNLLVDTAAGDLVIDEKLAVAAAIPHGGREMLHFAGGLPAMVTYGHVERLQLGSLAVHDILTQILDLQSRFAAYTPVVPIHGILGISVLSRFTTVLDFHQHTLRLDAGAPSSINDPANAEPAESPIWIATHQFVLARAETSNTETDLWVIDTGMTGAAFAISTASAAAGARATRFGEQETGIGGGGTVEGQRVLLPSLRLGDLDRRDVQGMALENLPLQDRFGFRAAGLLACEYFQDAVLSLNFSRMTLTAG